MGGAAGCRVLTWSSRLALEHGRNLRGGSGASRRICPGLAVDRRRQDVLEI